MIEVTQDQLQIITILVLQEIGRAEGSIKGYSSMERIAWEAGKADSLLIFQQALKKDELRLKGLEALYKTLNESTVP